VKVSAVSDRLLEHYAAHGTDEQRRLAGEALETPAATLSERMSQLFRVMGPKEAAAIFRQLFPGCEIDGPPASDTEQ
jgi:hypothetical protein